MTEDLPVKLYFPYSPDTPPKFVTDEIEFRANKGLLEGYSISEDYSLLVREVYNGVPNPWLEKYGVFYPGAALLIKEDAEDIYDVEEDILNRLQDIFDNDCIQREKHATSLLDAGFVVIG